MTFSVDVPLRWGDMDAYGHVNNVTYLQYLEEARVGAFAAWFPDADPVAQGIVVASAHIEYLRPLLHRTRPVRVDVWVSSLKGASFALDYVVREPDDASVVYAQATSTLVLYDLAAGSPRRMDAATRARLEQETGEPVPLRGSK